MFDIGFSTGALALDDFRNGLALHSEHRLTACELSALREDELQPLVDAFPSLELGSFRYCSFHAPSNLKRFDDEQVVELLKPMIDRGIPIVVHPDIIQRIEPWKTIGELLLLENMDSRKQICQTARDLHWFFTQLPAARFCFDIGHAHQIDPTMSVATDLLLRFRDRIAEIHISEVNWQCKHVPISSAAKWAFLQVAALIPKDVPIIIESLIDKSLPKPERDFAIAREIATVKECLMADSTNEIRRYRRA